jgi:hypothetical protein
MAPCFKVAQELRPMGFGLTDEDYVRVRLRLIGHESHMRSSKHDRNSPLPETVCHGVDMRRTRGVEGNRNQICWHIEIDRPDYLVDVEYSPMRRHEGS